MVGRVIAHYQVLEKLGEGGMGVVYKARDTHLDRFVALKVLAPGLVANADRQRRFVQEAKSASSLNNSNIVTLFDINTVDGITFIAMEYIEGCTLQDLIPANGLPPAEALKFAIQIAGALAAVHARGIIHRDLKPRNVMVTRNSSVKVLDFGLAKLTEQPDADEMSTLSRSPHTVEGAIVGTVAYMSPEQAEGKPLDARSDIFSFGAVLYQMLTGRQPFQGSSRISTMSAILRDAPVPPARLNPSVPPEIERITLCCLEKDPDRRFQHAADLKMALEWLQRDSESSRIGPLPLGPKPSLLRPRNIAVAALAVGIFSAAVALYLSRSKPPSTLPPAAEQITFDSGLTCSPALSPDGKLLAYISDRAGDGNLHIWVQQLSGGAPIQRTRTPVDDFSPSFTPDGLNILFERAETGIFITPVLNGEERLIAPRGHSPRCSPDGHRLLYWVGSLDNRKAAGAIFTAPLGEGVPERLVPDFADARHPLWSPDGKSVLFQGARAPGAERDWWVVPAAGGNAVKTEVLPKIAAQQLEPYPGPSDWADSQILFSAKNRSERHIWSIELLSPFNRPPDPARQLTFGIGADAEPSASKAGSVVFASYSYRDSLWLLPLNGGDPRPGSLQRMREARSRDSHPSLSADARMLAFLSGPPGQKQVWLRQLPDAADRELTFGPAAKSAPVIAPDGSRVAYSILENGSPSIYAVRTGDSKPGPAQRVCEKCGEPAAWTRNADAILFATGNPQSYWTLNLATGTRTPILQHPELALHDPGISPDGRWITFVAATDADRSRVFVAPLLEAALAPPESWIGVTDGSEWDAKPAWMGNDTLVFYSKRDRFGCLWKQSLQPASKRPIGPPSHLYGFHTLRQSPRTLFDSSFTIAVARDTLVLNQAEISGNIWSTVALKPD